MTNLLKLTNLVLTLFVVISCGTLNSRNDFSVLKIGMHKDEVEKTIGKSWNIAESQSGSEEIHHIYGDAGYVWYDNNNKLKGFASSQSNIPFASMAVSRASGYKIQEINGKKFFLSFESFKDLKSEEARMVYLENKRNIEKMFQKLGYNPVKDVKSAEIIIVCKLGISDPKVLQEIVSRPIYNLAFTPSSNSTTNFYGSKGQHLGSTRTTSNQFGTYHSTYGGQHTETITTTTFMRNLEFYAFDARLEVNSEDSLLWSSKVVSEGSSEDIRMLFPYLLFASKSIINKSITFNEYQIPGFHTGVFELIGSNNPSMSRNPANKNIQSGNNCNPFLTAIRYQGCN